VNHVGIAPHQLGCTACHGMSIGHKAVIQAAHVLTGHTKIDVEPDDKHHYECFHGAMEHLGIEGKS
jgi:tetrahydrodipicolinate N-succinyltransferase